MNEKRMHLLITRLGNRVGWGVVEHVDGRNRIFQMPHYPWEAPLFGSSGMDIWICVSGEMDAEQMEEATSAAIDGRVEHWEVRVLGTREGVENVLLSGDAWVMTIGLDRITLHAEHPNDDKRPGAPGVIGISVDVKFKPCDGPFCPVDAPCKRCGREHVATLPHRCEPESPPDDRLGRPVRAARVQDGRGCAGGGEAMTLTETITWIPVAERLPDAEDEIDRRMGESRTVLAWIDGAAFRTYLLLATGEWRLADDNLATGIAPTHWAEVPRGPEAER